MFGIKSLLFVMLGGAIGAVCRHTVSWLSATYLSARFPAGTFLVNMIGCFLIGIAFAAADRLQWFNPAARLFFMTGFLGALTTFSTYALESVQAYRAGDPMTAVVNILANTVGGIVLVLAGMWMARRLLEGY